VCQACSSIKEGKQPAVLQARYAWALASIAVSSSQEPEKCTDSTPSDETATVAISVAQDDSSVEHNTTKFPNLVLGVYAMLDAANILGPVPKP
jgi:hypothetical protein